MITRTRIYLHSSPNFLTWCTWQRKNERYLRRWIGYILCLETWRMPLPMSCKLLSVNLWTCNYKLPVDWNLWWSLILQYCLLLNIRTWTSSILLHHCWMSCGLQFGPMISYKFDNTFDIHISAKVRIWNTYRILYLDIDTTAAVFNCNAACITGITGTYMFWIVNLWTLVSDSGCDKLN